MIELSSTDVREITVQEYNVSQINSIAKKYPELRSKSKAPSFALSYAGTYYTLMKNCGFTEEEAKEIETNYHKMYEVSDKWVEDKLLEASEKGYVTLAFGLKLRTPLLAKSVLKTSRTPKQTQAEARSAGNAFSGQSYGLLNNRAAVAFMREVWSSPYASQIRPIALIHDALYFVIANDPKVVLWVNEKLIEAMSWQELPELKHPSIKLGAELELYPSWAEPITLPNGCTEEHLLKLVEKYEESA